MITLNKPKIYFSGGRRVYDFDVAQKFAEVREAAINNGWHCFISGQKFTKNKPPSVDHFRPVVIGGNHDMGNIVLVTRDINQQKGKKHPENFIRELLQQEAAEGYNNPPKLISNMAKALGEYKRAKTPSVDGEAWFKSLKGTLSKELAGLNGVVSRHLDFQEEPQKKRIDIKL